MRACEKEERRASGAMIRGKETERKVFEVCHTTINDPLCCLNRKASLSRSQVRGSMNQLDHKITYFGEYCWENDYRTLEGGNDYRTLEGGNDYRTLEGK